MTHKQNDTQWSKNVPIWFFVWTRTPLGAHSSLMVDSELFDFRMDRNDCIWWNRCVSLFVDKNFQPELDRFVPLVIQSFKEDALRELVSGFWVFREKICTAEIKHFFLPNRRHRPVKLIQCSHPILQSHKTFNSIFSNMKL